MGEGRQIVATTHRTPRSMHRDTLSANQIGYDLIDSHVIGEIRPFMKWAGGKRWLATRNEFNPPAYTGRYIEPFLGSGAIFFSLLPRRSLLSDANTELIDTYCAIRDRPDLVLRHLQKHAANHSRTYYYHIRQYRPHSRYAAAARTIYLNRTCWNGLYRVNSNGNFNVPIGTKTSVLLPNDQFQIISDVLKCASIQACDFEESVDQAQRDDFLFLDPPYTVAHKLNGFIKYNDAIFSWEDQVRLRDALLRASRRRAKFLLTNASHESILELYTGFVIKPVQRSSVISGKRSGRGSFEELLISNY